jgi:hypothetical protein
MPLKTNEIENYSFKKFSRILFIFSQKKNNKNNGKQKRNENKRTLKKN